MSFFSKADRRTVAVIGAGFSGLLSAIHLLRSHPLVDVRLVEKDLNFGRGRAYRGDDPAHLLNVRAANMSAFPDRPSHFEDWLRTRGEQRVFVSRGLYGDYLQSLLREAVTDPAHAGRLLLEGDEAVGVDRLGDGRFTVRLALGRSLEVDAVILAQGAPAPGPPAGVGADVLASPAYVADPWRFEPSVLPEGEVLLLGSGLTMVDVAISLEGRQVTALSRRGLVPRRHASTGWVPRLEGDFGSPEAGLRSLRRLAATVGWREAVDALRPFTAAIWSRWNLTQRARFLRHASPWWEVRRHRMAPDTAERVELMKSTGRLHVIAGRLEGLFLTRDGVSARLRRRGAAEPEARSFAAVVNCTGASGALEESRLLARLLALGAVARDPLGLGLQVDARLSAGDGLYVVGPLARGAFWEATAVPDLRNLAARAAASVLEDLALLSRD